MSPLQMCTQPQVILSPTHNPQNKIRNYFLQKRLWHPSYAKIHVFFLEYDNVKTFKYMCHDESFSFCLKICTNVNNKYKKGYLFFFFGEKKQSLD